MKGEKTSLVVEAEHGDNIPNQDVETGDLEAESDRIEVNIAVGLFVAAIYDNAWHVGKTQTLTKLMKNVWSLLCVPVRRGIPEIPCTNGRILRTKYGYRSPTFCVI